MAMRLDLRSDVLAIRFERKGREGAGDGVHGGVAVSIAKHLHCFVVIRHRHDIVLRKQDRRSFRAKVFVIGVGVLVHGLIGEPVNTFHIVQ